MISGDILKPRLGEPAREVQAMGPASIGRIAHFVADSRMG